MTKINNLNTVEIWGTGKPIREWLYVEDGARSLIKSIIYLMDTTYLM